MSEYEEEEFMFNPSAFNEDYDSKNDETFGDSSLQDDFDVFNNSDTLSKNTYVEQIDQYDFKNDETFGSSSKLDDENWSMMEKKSKELEDLKDASFAPYYNKEQKNDQNLEHMLNFALDEDYEEEEEEIIFNPTISESDNKIEKEYEFGFGSYEQSPSKKHLNQNYVGSPQTQKILSSSPQTNTPKRSQFLGLEKGEKFKDYKKMKGYDINFIVKQQLLGLDMEDNYIDDYYFCATFSKKVFGSLQFPPNSVLNSLQLRDSGNEKMKSRYQTPRFLIQLSSTLNTTDNGVSSNKNTTYKTLKIIEEARMTLFKIEDLCLCYRDSPKSFTQLMKSELDSYSFTVLQMIQQNIVNITKIPKGEKLITKALMTLPESYSQVLIKEMLKTQTTTFEAVLRSMLNVIPVMGLNLLCETLNGLNSNSLTFTSKIGNDFSLMLIKTGDSRTFGNHIGWNMLKNEFISKIKV
eukprot:gene6745-10910_t